MKSIYKSILILFAATACIDIYVPVDDSNDDIVEEYVPAKPTFKIDRKLTGTHSSVFICQVNSEDRVFQRGGIRYGLTSDLEDASSITELMLDNMLMISASDLLSDTLYYYHAYVTDSYGTEVSDTFSFRSPRFTLSEADYHLTEDGGKVTVTVDCFDGFTFDFKDCDWIHEVSPTKSNREFSRTLIVDANTAFTSRYAEIEINSPDAFFNRSISFYQDEAPLEVKDPMLQRYLVENYDKDGNGSIRTYEITAIDIINLDISKSQYIKTLEGIEHLSSLSVLKCPSATLPKKVDLSGNHHLRELDLNSCSLSSIDLKSNTELLRINLSNNNLTSIDLGSQPLLEECILDNNRLSDMDLHANVSLQNLDIACNRLTSMPEMSCTGISCIDVSGNAISSIDLRAFKNLKELKCSNCSLESLSVINNKQLETLCCDNNKLSTLYVKDNAKLRELDFSHNKISRIDLRENFVLETLRCNSNALKELDLHSCINLDTLDCANNDFEKLDVSRCGNMSYLNCNRNLKLLYVDYNCVINDIYPDRDESRISPNTVIASPFEHVYFADENLLREICAHYDADGDGFISVEEALAVTSISISGEKIGSLAGIEKCINLRFLKFSAGVNASGESLGRITTVDLSHNTELEQLICSGNRLTSLDISKNTKLRTLWCDYNEISDLQCQNNTLLEDINCEHNRISILDLRKNVKLSALDCSPMQFENTNVLNSVYIYYNLKIPYINHSLYPRNISNIPKETTLYTYR